MRRKALITGVLPSPFVGPWVTVDEGEWTYYPVDDFEGQIVIEMTRNGSSSFYPLEGEELKINAEQARVVISEAFEWPYSITVNLYA